MKYRLAFLLLAAFGLTGCVPFLLNSDRPHFSPTEYVFPLAEGSYALEDGSDRPKTTEVSRADKGTALRTTEPGRKPFIFLGGFVALPETNLFVLQIEDAFEENTQSDKAPGETAYVPALVDASGATFFVGPKACQAECDALLSRHGFTRGGYGQWRAPKELSKERLIAFYRDLAPLLPGPPGKWETMRLNRIR